MVIYPGSVLTERAVWTLIKMVAYITRASELPAYLATPAKRPAPEILGSTCPTPSRAQQMIFPRMGANTLTEDAAICAGQNKGDGDGGRIGGDEPDERLNVSKLGCERSLHVCRGKDKPEAKTKGRG